MKTSPTTSDATFRAALLDVLYAQWREFGVPFNASLRSAGLEVIDPEELIWCSLKFTPSDPRLAEGVNAWIAAHRTRINRQRLNKLARTASEEPRAERWLRGESARESENSPTPRSKRSTAKPIGVRADRPSTLLLRSRDVLGNDCRSFLIAQLISNPRGVRLRDVAKRTGYTYRSISDAAVGWERAGVVRIDHGHCVLVDPAPWCDLLNCTPSEVVTVDWHAIYAAAIELLLTLEKARAAKFAADHPLVDSAIRATNTAFEIAAGGAERSSTPTLALLRDALVGA